MICANRFMAVGCWETERAQVAMRSAEDVADRAMVLAEEAAREAKQAALEYKDDAEEWAEENAEELRAQVRAQPIASQISLSARPPFRLIRSYAFRRSVPISGNAIPDRDDFASSTGFRSAGSYLWHRSDTGFARHRGHQQPSSDAMCCALPPPQWRQRIGSGFGRRPISPAPSSDRPATLAGTGCRPASSQASARRPDPAASARSGTRSNRARAPSRTRSS